MAAQDSDRHPFDIKAVRTTLAGAARATHSDSSSISPPPTTAIYLLAMRGHFSCNTCSHPHGEKIGPGSVITLEFAITNPTDPAGFGFTNRYPNLTLAGSPVQLAGH